MALSKIINETEHKLSAEREKSLGGAIKNFAEKTGISVACVYVYDSAVYPRQMNYGRFAASVGCLAALAVGIFVVIAMVKRLSPSEKEGEEFVVAEEDKLPNMQSNEYSVGDADAKAKRTSTEREIKNRNKKKDDRYRRGYDKSRYKKK